MYGEYSQKIVYIYFLIIIFVACLLQVLKLSLESSVAASYCWKSSSFDRRDEDEDETSEFTVRAGRVLLWGIN